MAPHAYIADSGNTARNLKKLYIADGGGVARQIKKLYVADASGVARLVYVSSYTGSLVAQQKVSGSTVFCGYDPSESIGSITPPTDTNGNTIGALVNVENTSSGDVFLTIEISGSAACESQSYFTSLILNGVTYASASATSFTPGSNSGAWLWDGVAVLGAGTYPVTIN